MSNNLPRSALITRPRITTLNVLHTQRAFHQIPLRTVNTVRSFQHQNSISHLPSQSAISRRAPVQSQETLTAAGRIERALVEMRKEQAEMKKDIDGLYRVCACLLFGCGWYSWTMMATETKEEVESVFSTISADVRGAAEEFGGRCTSVWEWWRGK